MSSTEPKTPTKPTSYEGWSKGDKAKRKGELCTVTVIHFETHPPSVTVRMDETGNEVGTEFEYLTKVEINTNANNRMIKKEKEKSGDIDDTSDNKENGDNIKNNNKKKNKRKRESFGSFFEQRRQRFENKKSTSNDINNSNTTHNNGHNNSNNNNNNNEIDINDIKTNNCDSIGSVEKFDFNQDYFEPANKRRRLNKTNTFDKFNNLNSLNNTTSYNSYKMSYSVDDIEKRLLKSNTNKSSSSTKNNNYNNTKHTNTNNINSNNDRMENNSINSNNTRKIKSWSCAVCTFVQSNPLSTKCEICNSPKSPNCKIIYEDDNEDKETKNDTKTNSNKTNIANTSIANGSNNGNNSNNTRNGDNDNNNIHKNTESNENDSKSNDTDVFWTCPNCTLIQTIPNARKCEICGHPSPNAPKPSQNALNSINGVKGIEGQLSQVSNIAGIDTFTFATWNVWFREELEINRRIEAIGKHLVENNVDIVALQEVTPNIFEIIQSSQWFINNNYKCCKITQTMKSLPYFCIILSKFNFVENESAAIPFKNSRMFRYLYVAAVNVPNKNRHNKFEKIIVGTTHLESPVGPNSGGTKDKFSKERKEQLKLCLDDVLSSYKNNFVIFGGDFNWIGPTKKKENDGLMVLPNNWKDCWMELHPNDKGFTYDCFANPMLLGYYKNRLDRILIKQSEINNNGNNNNNNNNNNNDNNDNSNECKLESIEMIGKTQIDNLTYKQKCSCRKSGEMIKTLPVLPSDHFGLCSKFTLPK